MRIAYISTIKNAPWGGSEELWFQCAKKAIDESHSIGVFVYDWTEEPAPLKYLKEKGALIGKRDRFPSLFKRLLHRIFVRFGAGGSLYLNPYKEVINFKPDCIVVTDGATYYASDDNWLRSLLVKYFEGRYIIVIQGNGPYHFPADRSVAISFFQKAKRLVFVAENNRVQAFHQLASRLDNTLVIQNPVNLAAYDSIRLPEIKDHCIHFAMVGRLTVSDKGQDIVIAMMADSFWRKQNIRIHIYGKGMDLDYIKKLVAFYGVEDKVILEGHATIEHIWKHCHALLMPSIVEGTPLTLLEAMVLGRICIVTRVGGNDEWIVDGKNGFLAEAPTQELFSAKMKEALQSVDRWPDMAKSAHLDALARLDSQPGNTLLQQIIS